MSGGPCLMLQKQPRIVGINSGGENDRQNEGTRISNKIIQMFEFTKQLLGNQNSKLKQSPQKKRKVTHNIVKRKSNASKQNN